MGTEALGACAWFIEQQTPNALLVEIDGPVEVALDRLFGLERLRDVLGAIPTKVVRDALADLQQKKDRAVSRLTGAAGQIEEQRQRAQREAEDLGLAADDLTFACARGIVNQLREQLQQAYADDSAPEISDPAGLDDLERIARRVREATKALRLAAAGVGAGSRLAILERLARRIDESGARLSEAEEALEEHMRREGDEVSLSAARKRLVDQLQASRAELARLDGEQRMLSDALALVSTSADRTTCPVCEQRIDAPALAASLRSRVEETMRDEHARLHRQMTSVEDALGVASAAAETTTRLVTQRTRAADEVDAAMRDARHILELTEDAGPLEVQRALGVAIADLGSADAAREALLQKVDADVDRLRVIARVVKADEDYATVRSKSANDDGTEAPALEEELERLATLQESLEAIARAVTAVARTRAQDAVDSSREPIATYYRQLCNHPYFDGVRIAVDERNVKGIQRNTYAIQTFATSDDRPSLASSRLSTAQMNCVALSVYLALSGALTHRLGFVILDDPSQSLDTAHKAALATVLHTMLPTTQLVIATQDAEFRLLLCRQFVGEGCRAYELSWSKASVGISPAA